MCLLHGGFWRMPYGRDETAPLAADLAHRGYAAWNLEYRRLGAAGGGWPGTFDDVAAGVDHLASLADHGADLDLDRVAVVGHSAGGHLALWVAGRHRIGDRPPPRVRVAAAVGQAPLADLARALEVDALRDGVARLLGANGGPVPKRVLDAASPRALVPLGVPQLVVHGAADDVVPIEIGRGYAAAARAAGDAVDFVELAGAGHFEHVDPASTAWSAVVGWLDRVLAPRPSRSTR